MKRFVVLLAAEITSEMLVDPNIGVIVPSPIYLVNESDSGYRVVGTSVPNHPKFDGFKIFDATSVASAANAVIQTGSLDNRQRISITDNLDSRADSYHNCFKGTHVFSIATATSAYQDYNVTEDVTFSELKYNAVNGTTVDKIDVDVLCRNDDLIFSPLEGCYVLEPVEHLKFTPTRINLGTIIRITYYNNGASTVNLSVNAFLEPKLET